MSKKLIAAFALAAIAAFTLPSFAGTTPAAHTAKAVTAPATHAAKAAAGELTAVDATAKTFSVKSKSATESFTLGTGATITMQGKAGQFSDLKIGQKVEVRYNMEGSNRVATSITILGHA